jgi:hypothetical protein
MSVDATCLEVPDTPRNERFFKRKGATRPDKRESAFPLAQIVGWLDSGQRLLCDLLIRSCRCGEQGPGLTLIRRRAEPGQIILWDCGFSGVHALAKACQEKGAHFLGRIRSNVYRQAAGVLSDGSYLVWLEPGEGSSPRDKPMLARIIEYKFGADGQRIRIITDLLHELAYPAEELAALYRERWEIENVFDEFKTHLLQGRPAGKATAIRAQRPAGVVQEIDGLALAHRVVRALMAAAAAATRQKLDPDRLSFTNSLGALRRPCPKSLRPRSKRYPPLVNPFARPNRSRAPAPAAQGKTTLPARRETPIHPLAYSQSSSRRYYRPFYSFICSSTPQILKDTALSLRETPSLGASPRIPTRATNILLFLAAYFIEQVKGGLSGPKVFSGLAALQGAKKFQEAPNQKPSNAFKIRCATIRANF